MPAIIDGAAGIMWTIEEHPRVAWEIIITGGRVTHIDMPADPRPDRLDITPP